MYFRPTLSGNVEFEVTMDETIPQFTYHLIGRGAIVAAGTVDTSAKTTGSHHLTFPVTFDLVPTANFLVYCMRGGDVVSRQVSFDLKEDLGTSIDIDAPEQAKPGEEVDLTIKTASKSFVGVLAVDKSVSLLKNGNDLEFGEVLNEFEQLQRDYVPRNYRSPFFEASDQYQSYYPHFQSANMALLTNIRRPATGEFLLFSQKQRLIDISFRSHDLRFSTMWFVWSSLIRSRPTAGNGYANGRSGQPSLLQRSFSTSTTTTTTKNPKGIPRNLDLGLGG